MNKYQSYLYDVGLDLKERALKAKEERDAAPPGSEDRTFHSGRVMGFNEAISIIQQNAQGLEISLAELRLDDIDPDRDLV